ncbi:MAG: 50S ribosomal protein L16 [Candidatus Thermoplasmatota archaeon]
MSRKPGSMYRYVRGQPATRKEYLGGIPASRITQFVMGNRQDEFPIKLSLIIEEKCQIRHNSLESSRIAATRTLEKEAGISNFRLRVLVYPHVVLRENKQATGAGADRVSQGMRSSFGRNVSVAARLDPKQTIMTVETNKANLEVAKKALKKAGCKLPSPCYLKIKENK